jgi:hypothetical protein
LVRARIAFHLPEHTTKSEHTRFGNVHY